MHSVTAESFRGYDAVPRRTKYATRSNIRKGLFTDL